MPSGSRFPVVLALVALGALWALAGAGCGRNGKVAVELPPPPPPPDLTRSPINAPGGKEAGLEVSLVVSGADQARLAGALAKYLDEPVPIDPAMRELWSRNGLRIVRIPLAEWLNVASGLKLGGAAQRHWVSQGPDWVEAVRAPDRPRGQVIALDAERLELGPGRLRLLARCWLTPLTPDAPIGVVRTQGKNQPGAIESAQEAPAGLVIELLPHCKDLTPAAGASRLSPALKPRSGEQAEGLAFERLRATMTARVYSGDLRGPYAYVLVPQRPGVDWRDLAGDRPESEGEPAEAAAAPGIGQVSRVSAADRAAARSAERAERDAGPRAPALPTLGEAIFGKDSPPATTADARPAPREPGVGVIAVLIPRVPATYELLPRVER